MNPKSDCPFCELVGEVEGEAGAIAFPDRYPSAEGHMLVVPRRHVGRVESLSPAEWQELFELVRQVAAEVSGRPGVDGINIGVNSGESAGQTVAHAHVHVIPRRKGDVEDPRGGVRWVLPETAGYWDA